MSKLKPGMTVRRLLHDGLKESKRSAAELAAAVEVPDRYIVELMSGDRRPPRPSRTDVYPRITRFLRLGRTDLETCAAAERAEAGPDRGDLDSAVREEMLGLCEARTAGTLRRRSRSSGSEVVDLIGRVLDVVQSNARRTLDQDIPLRIAASRTGDSFHEVRLRVLEFLDTSPVGLTPAHLVEFVRPQVDFWDVDLESGIVRVVLRAATPTENHRRRPLVRTGRGRPGA